MGSDAFEHLHTWSRWQQLIELAHIAAITRPGNAPYPSAETAGLLSSRRAADAAALHRQPAGLWLPLEIPQLDISSTRIRRLLKQIGRASCMERVCPYVWISVVAGSFNKKKQK